MKLTGIFLIYIALIQHIIPTNAHKIYKLLKYKIYKNIILPPRHFSVYVTTPSSGGYQLCFLLRRLRYKNHMSMYVALNYN
jgi:hypothetical protein